MAKKVSIEDVVKFFGNRNCLIRADLKGTEVFIKYSNGKLDDIYAICKNGEITHFMHSDVINIPAEIDYKGNIIINGVLTVADKHKNFNFIVYDVDDIEDGYEWVDDVDNEKYNTTNNSSVYNKINCAAYLGFSIVPLTTHTSTVDSTQAAVLGSLEMIKDSCKMLGYPFKSFTVLYNDTFFAKMMEKAGKPFKMNFVIR